MHSMEVTTAERDELLKQRYRERFEKAKAELEWKFGIVTTEHQGLVLARIDALLAGFFLPAGGATKPEA